MGLIKSLKSGWYEGKGHKYNKKGDYENALKFYLLALENADNKGGIPVLLEYISMTLADLNRYHEALDYAEQSLEEYRNLEKFGDIFKEGSQRVMKLVASYSKRNE